MPLSLSDFRRPPQDNGRGVHGIATIGWNGGAETMDFWVGELQALGVKWFKTLDDGGDSLALCKKLIAAGIFPVVRILRHDPPPNDSPEPNPGHMGAREEQTVKKLIDAGVLYFEVSNEPNLGAEWKNGAIPAKMEDAAKLVALNWLFDARFILDAGGYPALPAISVGNNMDLIGALVSLGRQDILLEGCWIAIHNYGLNHPLNYPSDRVNQTAAPLSADDYDFGLLTRWVWWNLDQGRPDSLDQVNQMRVNGKNTGMTVLQDHSCFREYEFYDALAQKYLGRSIPILSTESGPLVGRREDPRYPRITPQIHSDLTVAMFEFMQREAPDYYFANTPWVLLPSAGWQQDAWYGDFWERAFQNGTRTHAPVPPFDVPGVHVGANLPVVDAVKAMANVSRLERALPPAPVPPAQIPLPTLQPPPPPPPQREESVYVIQHGDTLSAIAKKFGTTVTAVVAANQVADPSRIFAGQRLLIPPPATVPAPPEPPLELPPSVFIPRPPAPPRIPPTAPPEEKTYFVLRGDTLSAIAKKFGTTVQVLALANNIADVNRIYPGEQLTIPPPAPLTATFNLAGVPPPPPRVASAPKPPPPPPPKPRGMSELDPRLGALNVRVLNAMVSSGQAYWKLARAEYQDPDASGGNHHIHYSVLDENGAPVPNQGVFQGWPEDQVETLTDVSGSASIALSASYSPDHGESGPYSAWVDGLPSDRVTGLGLPLGRNVTFKLTWQKAVK